jgi:hypothetical protein
MVRLGAKLPFRQAQAEIAQFNGLTIGATTLQRQTQQYGAACEAATAAQVAALEREGLAAGTDQPKLMVSADGCFVALTTGEWREVKTVAVGEYEASWDRRQGEMTVQTSALSYYSRSGGVRDFERLALAELSRRGLDRARQVVAVNDGASWIQSFLDYHAPQAIRILDFSHAAGYVATLGKAVLGEESSYFPSWFQQQCRQLKHHPPQRTLADLAWFGQQATSPEQQATVAASLHYLTQRQAMIDYPHFRLRGLPIGSGSVESSHKQVVQARMKQAGMRWADAHLNGFLALRNLIANDRWDEGWLAATTTFRRQRRSTRPIPAKPIPPPLTLDDVLVAEAPTEPTLPAPQRAKRPFRFGKPSKWARFRAQQADS